MYGISFAELLILLYISRLAFRFSLLETEIVILVAGGGSPSSSAGQVVGAVKAVEVVEA